MPQVQINLEGWQDYRGKESGVLIYVETSHQSAVPVRDQLNENGKGYFFEPNYETSTWGLESCLQAKQINAAVKAKHKYLLFGTRYEGFNTLMRNKYIITGFLQIEKTKDVRSRHLQRYMAQEGAEAPECIGLDRSMAVWGTMHFVGLEDCFVLTDEWIKKHGLSGRATRQLRLVVEGAPLQEILDCLRSKPNAIEDYIATVEEFKTVLAESAQSIQ